jgi:hypothetical protein
MRQVFLLNQPGFGQLRPFFGRKVIREHGNKMLSALSDACAPYGLTAFGVVLIDAGYTAPSYWSYIGHE